MYNDIFSDNEVKLLKVTKLLKDALEIRKILKIRMDLQDDP